MSQKNQEGEGEEVKLVNRSELLKRFNKFLVGEADLSQEDREELGKVTHICDEIANPNWYPEFKDMSKVNGVLDLRPLKNARLLNFNFCFQNKEVKKMLWDFQKLEEVKMNFLYQASNVESVDFASWHSIKVIEAHGFWAGRPENAKLLNAHKLKNVKFEYKEHPCCQWLMGEIKRQVHIQEVDRHILSVHLIAFKGSSKVSKMMSEIYVPRIVVLKFLIGNAS